jgi:hypothetical protein
MPELRITLYSARLVGEALSFTMIRFPPLGQDRDNEEISVV